MEGNNIVNFNEFRDKRNGQLQNLIGKSDSNLNQETGQANINMRHAIQDFETLYGNVFTKLQSSPDSLHADIDVLRLFANLAYMEKINGFVPDEFVLRMKDLQRQIDARFPENPDGGPAAA